MCRSSLNQKTGCQTARILIRLIMQFGGIAADGVSSQNVRHWPAETCGLTLWENVVVSLYVSVNWVKSMCSGHIYHNFSCCDDLNSLKCQFCTFFSIKLRKFWHTARLSRTNRHKVIKSEKQSGFFLPTLYIVAQKLTDSQPNLAYGTIRNRIVTKVNLMPKTKMFENYAKK